MALVSSSLDESAALIEKLADSFDFPLEALFFDFDDESSLSDVSVVLERNLRIGDISNSVKICAVHFVEPQLGAWRI